MEKIVSSIAVMVAWEILVSERDKKDLVRDAAGESSS
jgi:hypothetical protein